MGCVRVGEAAKGGTSGWIFAPRAKKLVLQVSKKAGNQEQGVASKRAGNEEQGVGLP